MKIVKLQKSKIINDHYGAPTHYLGSIVYTKETPDYILTSEGRAVPNRKGGFDYEYSLTDYLGNTRVSFNQSGEVLQVNNYYAFGMSMGKSLTYMADNAIENKYKYNGKEMQDDFGLDWYDYGARFYDAQLGRFHVQDAYAEKYFDLSTYQYGADNPIVNIDINGDSIWFTTQYDKSGELSGVTMNVSGKVINMSDNDVDMEKATADISDYMKDTFKGEMNGVSFSTETNITVAENINDINNGDHVWALSEFDDVNSWETDDGSYIDYAGVTSSNKVSYIDVDYFKGIWDTNFGTVGERTASHEMTHMMFGGYVHSRSSGSLFSSGYGNEITSGQLRRIYSAGRYGAFNKGTPFQFGKLHLSRIAASIINVTPKFQNINNKKRYRGK